MTARKTIEDYHAAALSMNYEWLGVIVPQTNKTFTEWRCPAGHTFSSTFNRIARNHGCPVCAQNIHKTITDYHVLASRRGFVCTSKEITTVHASAWWRCSKEHEFKASYRSIDRGDNCPYCSGKAVVNAGDYVALAAKRGFIWLGAFPKNAMQKTGWQCGLGHIWDARYNSVYNGQGCPECKRATISTLKKYTAAAYHELAASRGFRWVGTEIINSGSPTLWTCSSEHTWRASYNSIRQGSGCPYCLDMVNGVMVSKPQRAIYDIVDGDLNYPAGRYNIDVAVTVGEVLIAIEYDGWHWHQGKDETVRDAALFAMGWRLLRIRSDTLVPTPEQITGGIALLLSGETYAEITLPDWGEK